MLFCEVVMVWGRRRGATRVSGGFDDELSPSPSFLSAINGQDLTISKWLQCKHAFQFLLLGAQASVDKAEILLESRGRLKSMSSS